MHTRTGLSFSAAALIAAFGLFAGLTTAAASADDSAAFIGAWQGSWSGDSSGKFEMNITKGSAGKLSGSISPKPNDGEGYTVEFKTVEIASGKLTAKFEDPGGEVEIVMTGSVEGKSAKGTYTVHQKSGGSQAETGSWTATRK